MPLALSQVRVDSLLGASCPGCEVRVDQGESPGCELTCYLQKDTPNTSNAGPYEPGGGGMAPHFFTRMKILKNRGSSNQNQLACKQFTVMPCRYVGPLLPNTFRRLCNCKCNRPRYAIY